MSTSETSDTTPILNPDRRGSASRFDFRLSGVSLCLNVAILITVLMATVTAIEYDFEYRNHDFTGEQPSLDSMWGYIWFMPMFTAILATGAGLDPFRKSENNGFKEAVVPTLLRAGVVVIIIATLLLAMMTHLILPKLILLTYFALPVGLSFIRTRDAYRKAKDKSSK